MLYLAAGWLALTIWLWRRELGGKLSATTIAAGRVLLSSIDRHTLQRVERLGAKRSSHGWWRERIQKSRENILSWRTIPKCDWRVALTRCRRVAGMW